MPETSYALVSYAAVNVWRYPPRVAIRRANVKHTSFCSPFVHLECPMNPVRHAFIRPQKTFVAQFAFRSFNKKIVRRCIRRRFCVERASHKYYLSSQMISDPYVTICTSCCSTLVHPRLKVRTSVLHRVCFSVRRVIRQTYVVLYVVRSPSHGDPGGGVTPDIDGRIRTSGNPRLVL